MVSVDTLISVGAASGVHTSVSINVSGRARNPLTSTSPSAEPRLLEYLSKSQIPLAVAIRERMMSAKYNLELLGSDAKRTVVITRDGVCRVKNPISTCSLPRRLGSARPANPPSLSETAFGTCSPLDVLGMTFTREGLTDIALACGFADQSHLNRYFRRVVGRLRCADWTAAAALVCA